MSLQAENVAHRSELKRGFVFKFWPAWRELVRNKLAFLGLLFLLGITLFAVLGRWIAPYDPLQVNLSLAQGIPQPPMKTHLFGTDSFGRDILSRLISGAQISLSVGFFSVSISLVIGVFLGSLAGFYGGWVDNVITRLADIFLAIPSFFLILTVNTLIKPSIYNVMIIIGIFNWMGVARLVRGEILKLHDMDFIQASRALGGTPGFIIWNHLLPNSLAPIIVSATIRIPYAILLESSLSFLGLGVPPPQASWGNILYDSRRWLNLAWWMWLPPGVLISLTVISFNFLGDALRDALDPRISTSGS
jgi:peptide/nickel transport system permease protein